MKTLYLETIPNDSSQDGDIGRYTSLPCTTKRRITTKLKTKNNQKCYKIELYGSPTTKELKKKHPSRPVGGAETGSRVEDTQQGGGWGTRQSHIHMRINEEEKLESEKYRATQGCSTGQKPQNL